MKEATMGVTGVMAEQKFVRRDGVLIDVETTTSRLPFKGIHAFR